MEIHSTTQKISEKISSIILSFLKKEEVNFIFGMHGGYTGGFGEELNNFSEIKFIHCQHEEGAGFMADGYAKSSKKFGVLLTTAGPGLSNTFTAIISSYADGTPILHISGAIPKDKIFKGSIQDTSSFNLNISTAFKETTRFHADIINKNNFLQYFRNAIRYLFKGKKGPVLLNIGSDLFSQEVEHKLEYFRHFNNNYFDREASKHAIDVIKTSKSTLILAGYGVIQSKAQNELELLAQTLQVPVMVTPKGKASFNNESDLFLGVFGAGSNLIPEKYLETEYLETIIAIGTSFNEYSSDAWNNNLSKVKNIIQIDIDPYIIGRSFTNTYGIIGDAKTTINYLINKIKNEPISFSHLNVSTKIKSYKDNFENIIFPDKYCSEAMPLKPQRLYKDVFDSFYPYKVNFFIDNGSCIFWSSHYLKLRSNWKYFISLGFSSMGYAIPASIGGCLGDTSKISVSISGDGAGIMNGNELKTAAEYNVPVIFIILNDGRLGIVHHSTKFLYNRPNPGVSFKNRIDFVKFAEGLGVEAYRIEKPGQMNKNFIKKLIEKKKPILLDCYIDPEEIPPIGSRINQVKK